MNVTFIISLVIYFSCATHIPISVLLAHNSQDDNITRNFFYFKKKYSISVYRLSLGIQNKKHNRCLNDSDVPMYASARVRLSLVQNIHTHTIHVYSRAINIYTYTRCSVAKNVDTFVGCVVTCLSITHDS